MLILKDKVMAADDDLLTINAAGDTVRDKVFDARMALLMAQATAQRLGDDRFGHGVRVMFLQTCSQPQHIRFIMVAESNNLRNLWLGTRQRTGLVKDDRVGFRHSLKESATLNGQMMIARLFHRREHGDRHG